MDEMNFLKTEAGAGDSASVACGQGGYQFQYKSGEMIVPTDLSFPDCPERDPQQLRILRLEQTLRRAADFFRVIGSETMTKECEEALQSRPAPH